MTLLPHITIGDDDEDEGIPRITDIDFIDPIVSSCGLVLAKTKPYNLHAIHAREKEVRNVLSEEEQLLQLSLRNKPMKEKISEFIEIAQDDPKEAVHHVMKGVKNRIDEIPQKLSQANRRLLYSWLRGVTLQGRSSLIKLIKSPKETLTEYKTSLIENVKKIIPKDKEKLALTKMMSEYENAEKMEELRIQNEAIEAKKQIQMARKQALKDNQLLNFTPVPVDHPETTLVTITVLVQPPKATERIPPPKWYDPVVEFESKLESVLVEKLTTIINNNDNNKNNIPKKLVTDVPKRPKFRRFHPYRIHRKKPSRKDSMSESEEEESEDGESGSNNSQSNNESGDEDNSMGSNSYEQSDGENESLENDQSNVDNGVTADGKLASVLEENEEVVDLDENGDIPAPADIVDVKAMDDDKQSSPNGDETNAEVSKKSVAEDDASEEKSQAIEGSEAGDKKSEDGDNESEEEKAAEEQVDYEEKGDDSGDSDVKIAEHEPRDDDNKDDIIKSHTNDRDNISEEGEDADKPGVEFINPETENTSVPNSPSSASESQHRPNTPKKDLHNSIQNLLKNVLNNYHDTQHGAAIKKEKEIIDNTKRKNFENLLLQELSNATFIPTKYFSIEEIRPLPINDIKLHKLKNAQLNYFKEQDRLKEEKRQNDIRIYQETLEKLRRSAEWSRQRNDEKIRLSNELLEKKKQNNLFLKLIDNIPKTTNDLKSLINSSGGNGTAQQENKNEPSSTDVIEIGSDGKYDLPDISPTNKNDNGNEIKKEREARQAILIKRNTILKDTADDGKAKIVTKTDKIYDTLKEENEEDDEEARDLILYGETTEEKAARLRGQMRKKSVWVNGNMNDDDASVGSHGSGNSSIGKAVLSPINTANVSPDNAAPVIGGLNLTSLQSLAGSSSRPDLDDQPLSHRSQVTDNIPYIPLVPPPMMPNQPEYFKLGLPNPSEMCQADNYWLSKELRLLTDDEKQLKRIETLHTIRLKHYHNINQLKKQLYYIKLQQEEILMLNEIYVKPVIQNLTHVIKNKIIPHTMKGAGIAKKKIKQCVVSSNEIKDDSNPANDVNLNETSAGDSLIENDDEKASVVAKESSADVDSVAKSKSDVKDDDSKHSEAIAKEKTKKGDNISDEDGGDDNSDAEDANEEDDNERVELELQKQNQEIVSNMQHQLRDKEKDTISLISELKRKNPALKNVTGDAITDAVDIRENEESAKILDSIQVEVREILTDMVETVACHDDDDLTSDILDEYYDYIDWKQEQLDNSIMSNQILVGCEISFYVFIDKSIQDMDMKLREMRSDDIAVYLKQQVYDRESNIFEGTITKHIVDVKFKKGVTAKTFFPSWEAMWSHLISPVYFGYSTKRKKKEEFRSKESEGRLPSGLIVVNPTSSFSESTRVTFMQLPQPKPVPKAVEPDEANATDPAAAPLLDLKLDDLESELLDASGKIKLQIWRPNLNKITKRDVEKCKRIAKAFKEEYNNQMRIGLADGQRLREKQYLALKDMETSFRVYSIAKQKLARIEREAHGNDNITTKITHVTPELFEQWMDEARRQDVQELKIARAKQLQLREVRLLEQENRKKYDSQKTWMYGRLSQFSPEHGSELSTAISGEIEKMLQNEIRITNPLTTNSERNQLQQQRIEKKKIMISEEKNSKRLFNLIIVYYIGSNIGNSALLMSNNPHGFLQSKYKNNLAVTTLLSARSVSYSDKGENTSKGKGGDDDTASVISHLTKDTGISNHTTNVPISTIIKYLKLAKLRLAYQARIEEILEEERCRIEAESYVVPLMQTRTRNNELLLIKKEERPSLRGTGKKTAEPDTFASRLELARKAHNNKKAEFEEVGNNNDAAAEDDEDDETTVVSGDSEAVKPNFSGNISELPDNIKFFKQQVEIFMLLRLSDMYSLSNYNLFNVCRKLKF
jgi:hypothetical protein